MNIKAYYIVVFKHDAKDKDYVINRREYELETHLYR